MYKITVLNKGYIRAVYFNNNADTGLWQAKMRHGSNYKYRVESA